MPGISVCKLLTTTWYAPILVVPQMSPKEACTLLFKAYKFEVGCSSDTT